MEALPEREFAARVQAGLLLELPAHGRTDRDWTGGLRVVEH